MSLELSHAVIVAGPTCSGKSALALGIAAALGGVVINADSMQVYRELRVITARPSAEEEALVPHALYGVRPAAEAGNAAWWRGAALAEMERARAAGRLPVICGGTGMYFAALVDGIAEIPECGEAARAEARWLLAEQGPAALHASLAKVDPATAARLRPSDSQRVARAWEVWRGTGRGLVAWQSTKGERAPWRFSAILIDPPREALRAAIAGRFAAMLAAGALAEVRALLALGLDAALPAMRAHGVPELAAHLRGEMTLEAAARRAELVTGQYTKRQATWFRHKRMADPARTHTIHARVSDFPQLSESERAEIFHFIRDGA
jgi:tRNA dimethylallyltransferase